MAKSVIFGGGLSGQYATPTLQNAPEGKGDYSITMVHPHPKFT